MPLQKLLAFTKKVSDLADKPNQTMSTAEVKAQFDAAPDEVRTYLNNLIDALQSVTDGDSGADNIGVTPISTSPSTLQGILEWLKDQIDSSVLGQIPDGAITSAKLSSDAKKASNITVLDANDHFTSTDVENVLNELFQFANDGKTSIANVVGSPTLTSDAFSKISSDIQTQKTNLATNLTNKGQSSTGTETFKDLVDKVALVNTGKKWASGNVTASTSTLTVTGLAFKPKIVIVYGFNFVSSIYYGYRQTYLDSSYGRAGYETQFDNLNQADLKTSSSAGTGVDATTRQFTINNDGFSVAITINGATPYYWIAFE